MKRVRHNKTSGNGKLTLTKETIRELQPSECVPNGAGAGQFEVQAYSVQTCPVGC